MEVVSRTNKQNHGDLYRENIRELVETATSIDVLTPRLRARTVATSSASEKRVDEAPLIKNSKAMMINGIMESSSNPELSCAEPSGKARQL